MNECYAYVFNYNTVEILEIKVKADIDNIDFECLLEELGYNADECSWMFSNDKLDIKTID